LKLNNVINYLWWNKETPNCLVSNSKIQIRYQPLKAMWTTKLLYRVRQTLLPGTPHSRKEWQRRGSVESWLNRSSNQRYRKGSKKENCRLLKLGTLYRVQMLNQTCSLLTCRSQRTTPQASQKGSQQSTSLRKYVFSSEWRTSHNCRHRVSLFYSKIKNLKQLISRVTLEMSNILNSWINQIILMMHHCMNWMIEKWKIARIWQRKIRSHRYRTIIILLDPFHKIL
jgi:hypothetical protein